MTDFHRKMRQAKKPIAAQTIAGKHDLGVIIGLVIGLAIVVAVLTYALNGMRMK